MWQLQEENEHYSIFNWLNLISSPTIILWRIGPKLGIELADR